MKRVLPIFVILLTITGIWGCESSGGNDEDKSDTIAYSAPDVTYEIFLQSFADSDGDSIGDIAGAAGKLDYLAELGVDAIWLMPIMPSPSYHKYDVTDYYDIHPDYGTLDQFKAFVGEAHQRNIKVIIDLVINHSSDRHPWFISAKQGPESEFRDYYVWADKDSIADQIAKKETSFDSDNITQWHAPDGDTTALHYYGFFYGGMPDLNFDNPAVREEIYKIGRFWLEEVDVDGFRLDAAKHIYPDDRQEDNVAFWKEFLSEMEKVKPDVYTVGEVWANAETTAKFVPGFRALFNFDLAFSILESVNQGKTVATSIKGHGWEINEGQSFIDKLIENRRRFREASPEFTDAIFLSNHDQHRYMSYLENDMSKARLAASILLTLPGQPYIYYGEEIGMKGMKPDPNIREPFLWTSGSEDFDRTKWIAPVYTRDTTVRPLDEQMTDEESLWTLYSGLIAYRNTHSALDNGELQALQTGKESLLGYRVFDEEGTFDVIHNLSTEENRVYITGGTIGLRSLEGVELEGDSLVLPGRSTAVLERRNH